MEPSAIAAQLVRSGKITEHEKEIYFAGSDNYTPEDKATHDRVEKMVNEYNDSKTPPDLTGNTKVDTVTYPEDKVVDPKTEGMPKVLDSAGDKGSAVTVSTAALTTFRDNMAELAKIVATQYASVKTVDIKPGTFGAGAYISDAIQKGLRNDTLRFLQSVQETLAYIQTDINTLITNYDTTEERMAMDGQALNNLFNNAWSNVNQYGKYGNSSTDNIGGGNDDKDDKKS